MSFILPPKPVQPLAWPALVLYLGDLSSSMVYALHFTDGRWHLAALVADDIAAKTALRPGTGPAVVEVDIAADLRRHPLGTTTVVTSLTDAS